MMLRTELVLVLFRFIFVRHQIMRDLCHRRAAAEGEEPRGPCTRACAWRACTLAERIEKLRAAEAGGSTEFQPAPLAKMATGAGRVMSNALPLLC